MKTTDLQDLLKAVESIRKEMHPGVDQRFLEAVVAAEELNPEDDEGAIRAIQLALNVSLVTKGKR
jgi:hypothetical protein